MQKPKLIIGFLLLVLFGSLLLYLKMMPPLSASGISFYADDQTKRVIQIENTGLGNIKLKHVLVDGFEARKVELGVSRSNWMVVGGGLDENPDISFHEIDAFPIKPALTSKEIMKFIDQGDKESIKQYGLRIYGENKPKEVTIKYRYFGIPLSLTVKVEEQ